MDIKNTEIQQDINNAVNVLRKGGVILYPTDTVWGIGCDATNSEAVKRVFEIKQRAESKALIILCDSADMVFNYVRDIPQVAEDIINLTTTPLTIIYDNAERLAPETIAEDKSVGIRVPLDDYCKRLIGKFGRAIVSTSANFSGQPTPQTFKEIPQEIIDKVDYVCQYRRNDDQKHTPSGIIKLSSSGVVKIIR